MEAVKERKSSIQIWRELNEKEAISELIQKILRDKGTREGNYTDWYFLLDRSDNGMDWFCNALDYAEKRGIIPQKKETDIGMRPVSIDVFAEVRRQRKANRSKREK